MRLKKLKLKNFRSYGNEEIAINIDSNLTTIIGKNDVGKSSILEALEIFFNNSMVKIDNGDANNKSEKNDVRITCVFDQLPDKLVIDATGQTSLKDEYLLNSDGDLEIVKIYNCTGKQAPKESVHAYSNYPSKAKLDDLHSLTNDKLKERITSIGGIKSSNLSINALNRRALWDSATDLEFKEQLVPLDKEDGKKIWEQIQNYLPIYALFQSDRASKDEDDEVQDPMKIAINSAITELKNELEDIKKRIKEKAEDTAARTIAKLNEMNPDLAKELKPNFKAEPKWNSLFKMTLTDEDQIPINKRGSGTRRLILLNFFRAEAERKGNTKETNSIIYAIEEPETSQHPSNQEILIEALKDLGLRENSQVIITTHVPHLAGLIETPNIRFIKNTATGKIAENFCNEETLKEVASTLGVLPDKRVKVLVCVEGPNDIAFLSNIMPLILQKRPEFPDIRTDKRIALFPLGGSTLKQLVDNHYSKNLNLPEVHIYDKDEDNPPKYQDAADKVNSRGDGSIAFITQKRELENYIHCDAIFDTFNLSLTILDQHNDNIPQLLAKEIHLQSESTKTWEEVDEERKKKKEGNAKRKLNNESVCSMNLDRLKQVDKDDEIEIWFEAIFQRI